MGKITINGITRDMTAEEQAEYDTRVAEREATKSQRQLEEIKEIRLEKLQETDFYALSDVTMPYNNKTWRQSLRDLPQTYTTESEYDELLARETDKTKNNFGQLTHTVWEKP